MSESVQRFDSLQESLSAAVDGEADELELRRVLNAAESDAELRGKWARLHLIRSAIRGEAVPATLRQLPAWPQDVPSMPPAAEDHGVASGGRPARRSPGWRWLGPVTGVAVAAAAAMVVVVTFGPVDRAGVAPKAEVATASVPQSPGLAKVPSEVDLRRANAYLLQHAQHTSLAVRTAPMPFVKVVTVTASERSGGEERDVR